MFLYDSSLQTTDINVEVALSHAAIGDAITKRFNMNRIGVLHLSSLYLNKKK